MIAVTIKKTKKVISPLWQTPTETAVTQTPTLAPAKTIDANGIKSGYSYLELSPNQAQLIPNFPDSRSSVEIMKAHTCSGGINGGFYDMSGQPLGLFRVDGKTLSGKSGSLLINGFLTIDSENIARIDSQMPSANPHIALQAGPLLMSEGQTLPLAIRSDERARRMAAAITATGRIVFLALYSADSVFDGPLLGDLPALVEKIGIEENLNIVSAINLDGGSASAFYASGVRLAELTPVGSFFCVQ